MIVSVVGSIMMDLVIRSHRMPKEGESLIGSGVELIPGGKGANQAVAVQRLGGEARLAGRVGRDAFGDQLRRSLESTGVDTSYVSQTDDERTGLAVIMLLDSGQNSIMVAPGANMTVTSEDAEHLLSSVPDSGIMLLQLEVPSDVDRYIIERCKQKSVFTILDAGPASKCPDEIISGVDIITPNETEAEAITGIRVDSLDSARRAAGALLDMGAKTVVLKLGSRGSLLADGREMVYFPAFQVDPVDPTAAGDAFTGALAVKLSEGAGIRDAIVFANAVGALAVTHIGAQPSIPTRSEVEEFLSGQVVVQ